MFLINRRAALAALSAAGAAACAAVPPARIVHRSAPKVPIVDYKLDNGLRVILSPDHSAPVFNLTMMYNVGSRNELPGHTGFAHLFEHLMFQGSENVGKGEHFSLITEHGGTFNGTTAQERTVYYETMPANQIDLALFLEADRLRSLDVSQVNMNNQRDVVEEERRQRVDNEAYGSLYEVSLQQYFNSFAYQHSTIGSIDDLNAATLQDARDFFHTYYAPNNAVLVLAGDFKPDDVKKEVAKYFAAIPSRPTPPPVLGEEPDRIGERRQTITDNLATLPRLRRYYRGVAGDDPDFFALQVLGVILGGRGKTGRIYTSLVEPHLTLGGDASMTEMRTKSPFQIELGLPVGCDIPKVETALDGVIDNLRNDGVTQEELDRALVQLRTSSIAHLQKVDAKAIYLATYALYYNDPDRINTLYSREAKVTRADVQRVARKYLVKDNSATIIVIPGHAAKPVEKTVGNAAGAENAQ